MLKNNITRWELSSFIRRLTEQETKYYDIRKENLKTFVYVNGYVANDRLVGVGGIAKYYYLIPHTFYMIKQEYQGCGIGSIFSLENMKYAEKKYSFLVTIIEEGNVRAMKIAEHRGFKLALRRDTHSYYYKHFNGWGELFGIIFPVLVAIHYFLKGSKNGN
jgi:RimJ/RimL family protein N-acetyltransferase